MLSGDICRLILGYYVITSQDLLFIRQINQEWKRYAESSIFWFQFPLRINAPAEYLQHFERAVKNHYSYLRLSYLNKILYLVDDLGRGRVIYELFEPFRPSSSDFRYGLFLVECDPLFLRNPSVRDVTGMNRFEEAKKVFDWYSSLRIRYHSAWRREIRKVEFVTAVLDLLRTNHSMYIVPNGTLLSYCCCLLSFYGFYTLQTNLQDYGEFHWENYLSFLCLELTVFCVFVMVLLDFVRLIAWKFHYQTEIDVWKAVAAKADGEDLIVGFLLEILMILILVEIILCNKNAISWIYIIIPCLPMDIYAVIRLYFKTCGDYLSRTCKRICDDDYHENHTNTNTLIDDDGIKIQVYYALILIQFLFSLTILLYGLCLDGYLDVPYPYGYPLIPMLPIFFVISALFLSQVPDICFKMYQQRISNSKAALKKLGKILAISIEMLLNALLIVYAFKPELSTNSWISAVPPVFVAYLYLFSLGISIIVVL